MLKIGLALTRRVTHPTLALVLPLTATLVATPLARPGQTPWEEQVIAQIEAIHDEVAAGFDYEGDLIIGEIEEEDSAGLELEVSGNATYILVAVCDTDCSDIDLAVYDEVGDEVASDVELDDAPVVRVRGEGDYTVEVFMASCDAPTCAFAVQIFRRLD